MAPVPIEDDIKAELGEVVSQAMLVSINIHFCHISHAFSHYYCMRYIWRAQVGDQRKHLAVLLTLRTELDAKGQPTDNLHPEVKYLPLNINVKCMGRI